MLMKSERATASVNRLLLPRDNTKQSVSVDLNIKYCLYFRLVFLRTDASTLTSVQFCSLLFSSYIL